MEKRKLNQKAAAIWLEWFWVKLAYFFIFDKTIFTFHKIKNQASNLLKIIS
jgi:hypothetical protein